jgi:hypothetical protein
MFDIVSLLYHAVMNRRFVVHGNVFHYRELTMVRHQDNELVTKHSIRQFVHTISSSSRVSNDPEQRIEELVDALYYYVQFQNTLPMSTLYERDRLIHIQLIVPLTLFQRFGHVTLSHFGFSLFGNRDGIILELKNTVADKDEKHLFSDTSGISTPKDVYLPQHFPTLVEQEIMPLISRDKVEKHLISEQHSCVDLTLLTWLPPIILDMLNKATGSEQSVLTSSVIQYKRNAIYVDKAIIALLTHPMFEPNLVKTLTLFGHK